MSYLLDTNILVRWANSADANHLLVTSCIVSLHRQSEELCICRQNLIEFWAVATRPVRKNGLDWTIEETRLAIDRATSLFTVIPDIDDVYPIWLNLVEKYGITGVTVHDARIAALAIANGSTHLLTINVDDFKRFAEISVVHPKDVPLVD
jgi:predicted nucleic acid-binding protein